MSMAAFFRASSVGRCLFFWRRNFDPWRNGRKLNWKLESLLVEEWDCVRLCWLPEHSIKCYGHGRGTWSRRMLLMLEAAPTNNREKLHLLLGTTCDETITSGSTKCAIVSSGCIRKGARLPPLLLTLGCQLHWENRFVRCPPNQQRSLNNIKNWLLLYSVVIGLPWELFWAP